jgi:hypothetical protein
MRELEEIDTIPKPDGLGNRWRASHFSFDGCSRVVRSLFDLCAVDKSAQHSHGR